MRHIPIPPAAGSELADSLARLEAAESESRRHNQILAELRDEFSAADEQYRRLVYAGASHRTTDAEINAAGCAVESVRQRQIAAQQAAQRPIARTYALSADFDSAYADFMRRQRAASGR